MMKREGDEGRWPRGRDRKFVLRSARATFSRCQPGGFVKQTLPFACCDVRSLTERTWVISSNRPTAEEDTGGGRRRSSAHHLHGDEGGRHTSRACSSLYRSRLLILSSREGPSKLSSRQFLSALVRICSTRPSSACSTLVPSLAEVAYQPAKPLALTKASISGLFRLCTLPSRSHLLAMSTTGRRSPLGSFTLSSTSSFHFLTCCRAERTRA